jgi:hypothetical protein
MEMEDLDLNYDEFMKGYPKELELMDLIDWIQNSKCSFRDPKPPGS